MDSSNRYRRVYQTGEYADLSLRCRDKTFKVHKAIVCSASPFMAELVRSQLDSVLDLQTEPEIMERLLAYIYLGDYDRETLSTTAEDCFDHDPASSSESTWTADTPADTSATMETEQSPSMLANASDNLLLHAKMFLAARIYKIPALQEISLSRFEKLGVSEKDVPAFTDAVELIYDKDEDPNSRMKGIMISMASQQRDFLMKQKSFVSLLDLKGSMACDLLLAVLGLSRPQDQEHELDEPEPTVEVKVEAEAEVEETNEIAPSVAPPVYDKDGFDSEGYNKYGWSRTGFDKNGFDPWGMDIDGFGKDGLDSNGYDRDGHDRRGWNRCGRDKEGFDRQGYDEDGYHRNGYNKQRFNRQGYNQKGFDKYGYDRDGFNEQGYNTAGINREGFNKWGLKSNGSKKSYY